MVCGNGRQLQLMNSCQETCEHRKPLMCLPRPRCVCLDGKIWDEQINKCVFSTECVYKGKKREWTERDDSDGQTINSQNNTIRQSVDNIGS